MFQLTQLGTYSAGTFGAGAAEIVAFDSILKRLFVINATNDTVDILDVNNPTQPTKVATLDLTAFGGGVNSVAVKNGLVVVAVEATNKQDPGQAVFFDIHGNFLKAVTVGALPDMVTFTPDGTKVLVANEGEPNGDYSVDPEGSVSIIDLSNGVSQATVTTADFTAFSRQDLLVQGVRLFGPGATVAQDIEPEYITVSQDGSTAWITLQENNAIAVLDVTTGQITAVLPLGYKDHSLAGNELDASNRDGGINIRNWPIYGMYQPDAIASYKVGGTTYLVTANEGDSRVYPTADIPGGLGEGDAFNEEARIKDLILDPVAFPDANVLQQDANLGRLKVTTTLGDTDGDGDYDELYAFGGRSFSIWKQTDQGTLELVYDSGSELERTLAALLPNDFNSTNDENDSFDDRSDDKGPEPEGIAVGEVDGRLFAFIGLERVGGVMVYDITNPEAPQFTQYLNNRDFAVDVTLGDGSTNPAVGDLGPEGLLFIAAQDSPTGRAMLVVGNEVSGTTTVYDFGKVDQLGTTGADWIWGTQNSEAIKTLAGDDTILGNGGDDTIFAGSGNDWVEGGSGEDTIYGEAGQDYLYGNDGNDKLFGGAGDDWLDGGFGYDTLYGGEGSDTVSYDFWWGGVNLNLETGQVFFFNDRNAGVESVYEIENVVGSQGNDVIQGNALDNYLSGGDGNDVIRGGAGNDLIDGGYGYDNLDGGTGIDTVTMAYRHAGVKIDLASGYISFFDQYGYDTISNFENAIGTQYDDRLMGNSQNNVLEGLGGNDRLSGYSGNDTLTGGAGSDTLEGGSGYDYLIGVDAHQLLPGFGEVDKLSGGNQRDWFILGDEFKAYYDDGNSKTSGTRDYAVIQDFSAYEGDVIQLHGDASMYTLGLSYYRTDIYLKTEGQHELIGVVYGSGLPTSLTSNAFSYAAAA